MRFPTAGEKIALVEECMDLPRGGKAGWLLERGISSSTILRRRRGTCSVTRPAG